MTESAAKPARPPTRPKSARRRSREIALQGLYQWLIGGDEAGVVDAHMREQDGFDKCDRAHYDALLHGCITEASALERGAGNVDDVGLVDGQNVRRARSQTQQAQDSRAATEVGDVMSWANDLSNGTLVQRELPAVREVSDVLRQHVDSSRGVYAARITRG